MKRSALILRIAVICFIGYVFFTLISLQVAISQKKREIADLEKQVNDQTIVNEETKKALDESELNDLIRRFAENQGYAYQGEKIFIDEAGN